jgi:hypothetical protein
MKRPLIILLFLAGWLAAVLLLGGLMGLAAELVGMSSRTYHYYVLGALLVISFFVWLGNRWHRRLKYQRGLKWLDEHLDAHPEYAKDMPQGILNDLDRQRRSQNHLSRADQNELDCLEEMANTYRLSGYPSRDYIERCIREAEENIEPSYRRDLYLQDARDALDNPDREAARAWARGIRAD